MNKRKNAKTVSHPKRTRIICRRARSERPDETNSSETAQRTLNRRLLPSCASGNRSRRPKRTAVRRGRGECGYCWWERGVGRGSFFLRVNGFRHNGSLRGWRRELLIFFTIFHAPIPCRFSPFPFKVSRDGARGSSAEKRTHITPPLYRHTIRPD